MNQLKFIAVCVELCFCFLVAGHVARSEEISVALTADAEGHLAACQTCPGEIGLGGLARRERSLWILKEEYPNTLLLDAGNALFGGQSLASNGEVIVAAYNRIGYHAVQLTDADFFRGKDETIKLIEKAKFPFVSANLIDAGSDKPLVEPFIVKELGDQRVAILGVCQRPRILDMGDSLPPILAARVQQWNGIDIRPADEALDHWLPKAREKAERVILLYHGSPFGLRSIVKKFGGQLDAVCVSGIRPHQVSEDAKPPIIATSMHGRHIAHAIIADDGTAKIEQIAIEAAVEPEPEMQQLLANYTTTQPPPETVATVDKKMPRRIPQPVPDPAPDAPKPDKKAKPPQPKPEPSPSPPTTQPATGPLELLVNPSNELPLEDGKIVGWTAVKRNDWGQRSENPAPCDGEHYFFSGDNQSAELRQDVDVSRFADSIAAGKTAFCFSGHVRSYDTDSSRIFVEYRDAENENTLERFDSRSIANKNFWQRVSDVRIAPSGTGWIRVRMISVRNEGSNNDGYFDGLSLTAIDADTVGSGIKFVGRSEDDQPPASLLVFQPGSEEFAARLDGSWGEVPLRPGSYRVKIQPSKFFAEPLDWGEVEVISGEMTKTAIDSGIEVTAPNKDISPPESWYLHRPGREEPLMTASGGWGFTALPPGDYELRIEPSDLGKEIVDWADVQIEPGAVTRVRIDSGIRLSGRYEYAEPPKYWSVYRPGEEQQLTYVSSAWGSTPLPPGKYELRIEPGALGAESIHWSEVEIKEGEVADIRLDSGVALRGRDEYDPAPKYWYIYKPGSDDYLTYISGTWGFTPLPPGEYELRLTPRHNNLRKVPWASVSVGPGEVARVRVASGIELEAPDVFHEPPKSWFVHDAATDKLVTEVSGGWCYSPLLPGSYYVTCSYGGSEGKSKTVEVREDRCVTLILEELGIQPPQLPVERRTGIALSGRFRGDKPPKYWIVYDVESEEKVAQVGGEYGGSRWGMLPLPEGTYKLSLVPHGSGAFEIEYADDLQVQPGKVTKVRVDSGIELSGRFEHEPPPLIWYVYDRETEEKVAQVGNDYGGHRWGFTPLPPGKYRVAIDQGGHGSMEVPYQNFEIEPHELTTVRIGSGVELVGRTDEDDPPKYWLVRDAKTNKEIAQVGNLYGGHRWGYTPIPPGEYYIDLTYQGTAGRSDPFEVNEDDVVRITLGDLNIAEVEIELPEAKNVRLASGSDEIHVQVVSKQLRDSWKQDAEREAIELHELIRGAANGKYRGLLHRIRHKNPESVRDVYRVAPFYEYGHSKSTEYQGQEVQPGYRVYAEPYLFIWREKVEAGANRDPFMNRIDLGDMDEAATSFRGWIPLTGEASVMIVRGDLLLESILAIQRDAKTYVSFEPAVLARRHQIQWFQVAASDVNRVITMDRRGEHLLALDEAPPPRRSWLAPARSTIRLQDGKQETLHLNVPAGKQVRLDMEPNRNPQQKLSRQIQVDIAIQSPENGTVVESDRVTVTGLASTTGPAGSTRVAIVIDASGSAVDDSCGADLDGDGNDESILEAEVAAARKLLKELGKVERKAAGKTFEVAILRFASDADVMTPLLPLTHLDSASKLNAALNRILEDGSLGGTNFEPPIDKAVKLFQASERAGPQVIVFMSDGYPTIGIGRDSRSGTPEGFDAAARAGLQGVEFHGIGLGKDFQSEIAADLGFPPYPPENDGAGIIAHMAACGAPGSTATALPVPAKVVEVVSRLPVIEVPEAELKEVTVVNKTTGEPAFSVSLDRNGYFEADVPVSLIPLGEHGSNILEATAIAIDERFTASDRVTVLGKKGKIIPPQAPGEEDRDEAKEDDRPGTIKFDPGFAPAIQLILDSSGSMLKASGNEPKYVIAERVVDSLIDRLPDDTPVGFRLYGHLGFWTRPESPRAGQPPRSDPRWYRDSELVSKVSPLNADRRQIIKEWLDFAHPRGLTPLVYSLLRARGDFPSDWEGPKIIILVSDGKETCGGDLDDVSEAFADDDIVIHVVGFDIGDEDVFSRRTLERIAQFGGGQYFTVTTASELEDTLQRAVRSSGCEVLDTDGNRVTRVTLGGPAAEVEPGRYQIKLIGSQEKSISIDVTDSSPVTLTLTDEGMLTVSRTP